MPETRLRAELEKLHEALQETSTIDDAMRDSLSQLAADIDRLLQQPREETSSSAMRPHVEDLIIEFEAQHPQVSQILRRITELLSNMGI